MPSVSASINIPKEQGDYVGRWDVNLHQSAICPHIEADCGPGSGESQ